MRPIEFIGIRGGHCASTVAFVTAISLAARGPTRLAAHDPDVMCALAGTSPDRHIPIVLSENLDLVAGEDHGDVIDAGTLESYLDDEPFDDELAARRHSTPGRLVIGVLRGPDYLGLRTLCGHPEAPLDGLVVVTEAGRALDARDAEHVSGRTVLAVVEHTPVVARTIDAGLLTQRVCQLREFTQLRNLITQIATEDTPCSAPA